MEQALWRPTHYRRHPHSEPASGRPALLERRAALMERLDLLQAMAPAQSSSLSGSAGQHPDDVLEALVAKARDELARVNRALLLIAQGRYGSCEFCRTRIEVPRLIAVPDATTCASCAHRMDALPA
jgi:RNA polymerase-binding transcription factor DksA